MRNRLLLYDTSNFQDFPVGGQVTSIKTFLKYLGETHIRQNKDVLLVGVSTEEKDIGVIQRVEINGFYYEFLAVALTTKDLNNVKKSLRLEYAKGLIKYKSLIRVKKTDVNYIHTPEAFGIIKLLCPKSSHYVFSHGTYLAMFNQFRFFKKAPIVRLLFQLYLVMVVKCCDCVFVLDSDTEKAYQKYNRRVIRVNNSITCSEFTSRKFEKEHIRCLFAGRLSKVKNIGPIIEAVKMYHGKCTLKVVGAGEEMSYLVTLADENVDFLGALSPFAVKQEMEESDILIMNSIKEGIPMSILEALGCSMPVITTDVGGIKEVLNYGKDSEKTDGSVESIVKAIEKIADNYQEYSACAYQNSLRYDYRVVNQKIFKELDFALRWENR